MKNPTIRINNLVKDYYGKKAVDNITLNISESCFALLGPNGAGKTTTILMLLGLIKVTQGNASILGKNIHTGLNEIRRLIGYLPENVGFYSNLTGWEHVHFFERLRINSFDTGDDTKMSLEWCGLEEEYWHKKVKTYSKGMRQRLGLAQAFVGNPKIIFLDEPLSNIDPIGREDLVKKIKQKQREGLTIIISSHIIQEIEQIADFIAIIDKGKILIQDDYLSLAIHFGFEEFEINSFESAPNECLKTLYNTLLDNIDIFLDRPILLRDKIILKLNNIEHIKEIIQKQENFYYLRPVDGTLIKIYKQTIKNGVL